MKSRKEKAAWATNVTPRSRTLVLTTMLLVGWGCKPADDPPRIQTPKDPTQGKTSRIGVMDSETGWSIAPPKTRDAVVTAKAPPSPSPLEPIAQALARGDYSEVVDATRSTGAMANPELLALAIRAEALRGRPQAALALLDQLASLPLARPVLRSLRLHPDTTSLHNDRTFRRATDFLNVEVCPTLRRDSKRTASLARALKRAGIPARTGRVWRGKVKGATVFFDQKDRAAQRIAEEVRDELALPPEIVGSRMLSSKRPVVLVVPPKTLDALSPRGQTARLEDIRGRVHFADTDGETHEFVLRDTGFFRWSITRERGTSEERTGRYHLSTTKVALSYRGLEFASDRKKPTRVQQGRRSSHRFRLTADGFQLDDLIFRTK